jgi:hypothetical protein
MERLYWSTEFIWRFDLCNRLLGWSYEQAAAVFVVDEQTLTSWLRRIDEQGERALVQLSEPVNRFPDFVRYLVRQPKALCPTMGDEG